jgi:CcmD family protein
MAYLFAAFAVVWIGIFVYLSALVRRSRVLERQVAELLERSGAAPRRPSTAASRLGTGRP